MTTNFLFKQAPNRKGNASVREALTSKGVTAQTNTKHGTSHPAGSQGAPSYARASNNTAAGATAGRKQSVMVSRPKADYCGCNDGYMAGSSYLK
jgi:hypothetical protein